MSASFINLPCPFLPETARIISAADIAVLGKDRGPAFYEASLRYAQSQWRCGFPAQALLQCNRALSTALDLHEEALRHWPLPYSAMSWLMVNRSTNQFLGNPRRHFQHLATRMVEPNKALRTWRAWACWYLAKTVLPEADFPADWKQIRAEGLVEPVYSEISERLLTLSPANDHEAWLAALDWSKAWHLHSRAGQMLAAQIGIIGKDELPVVRTLAYAIWPQVYPGIITMEQINYMLDRRYDLGVLQSDLERGVHFALVKTGDRAVGFAAFEPVPDQDEAFLHKLYLLPEVAGCGVGSQALEWVTGQALALGLRRLRLFVNKQNAAAIRAYLRNGFTFAADIVTEIGGGFVMDDYVMVKVLRS